MAPSSSKLDVVKAEMLLGIPEFKLAQQKSVRGAKRRGLNYEAKVHDFLQKEHPNYVRSPWFTYSLRHSPNKLCYAQPDGLLIDVARGLITIVEIKYNHTADAYWQLLDKYLPIIECFFKTAGPRLWQVCVVEVVRYFDVTVAFPTQVQHCEDISRLRPGPFFVNICRPQE